MDNKRPGLRGVRAGCLTVQFSVIGWFLVLSLATGNQNDRRANQQQATNDVEDRGIDVVAIDPATVMMFRREDVLVLMQKDIRILENLMTEIASATYMLQQRLELFSYSGIAQKAAFWLLTRARQTGKNQIMIPESVSKWAMMMNVSRPSLHRELKRLESESIISYQPPLIIIEDQDRLQKILSL